MALARYQAFAQDASGNVLASPTVEVRSEDTSSLAALFSDRAGTAGISNPFTGDSDGLFAFHVVGGAYKIVVTKGAESRTFRYVAIGTAAETDLTSRNQVFATDFGVTADGSDETAKLQAAIDATPESGTLILPSGLVKVIGSGSACLAVVRPINIEGQGWLSGIFPDATVPNTRDLISITPSAASKGYGLKDFAIAAFGLGRHAIRVDGGANALIYNIHFNRLVITDTAAGNSINGIGSTSGVFAYSSIRDCNVESIKIDTCGDGLLIDNNVISATAASGTAAITVTQVAGAGGLNITNNVLTGAKGQIVIERGYPVITGNELEQHVTNTQANGAMIDLNGGTDVVASARVKNNTLSVNSGITGVTKAIRTANCQDAEISFNRIGVRSTADHIATTSAALDTVENNNSCYTDDLRVSCKMTDAGLRTAIVSSDHFITLAANQNGTNVNTAQPWFPGGGPTTFTARKESTYEFEGVLAVARTSGTTNHTLGMLFGGTATLSSIAYHLDGFRDTSGFFVSTSSASQFPQSAALAVLFAATTSANEHLVYKVRGIVRFNAAGTFIPQFKYDAAPGGAPVVQANSYFRMRLLGQNTVLSRGFT